jgi:hypothetical protein
MSDEINFPGDHKNSLMGWQNYGLLTKLDGTGAGCVKKALLTLTPINFKFKQIFIDLFKKYRNNVAKSLFWLMYDKNTKIAEQIGFFSLQVFKTSHKGLDVQ